MTGQEARVLAYLDDLGVVSERYEHPPIATSEEGETYWSELQAAHCKNLFLRNQKGDRHYLLIVPFRKRADLRRVAEEVGDGKLSFASPERLMTHLGLTPGSVSPFGLINDEKGAVRVLIDRDLKVTDRISFHPNINTATIILALTDFERFLASRPNSVQFLGV